MCAISVHQIRPVAWKICVQGGSEVQYVCRILGEAGIFTTQPQPEPGLTDPPVYAFVASARGEGPLTEEELVAILEQDKSVDLAFNSS
jgi:hypothetical protein